MNFVLIALVVGLPSLLIYIANRGRQSDIAQGTERTDSPYSILPTVGKLLLGGGVLAAIASLQINPVIQSSYGVAEYHPEVASRQQIFLIISGFAAVIGAIITFRKKI
jgi:hypothetical protein